MLLIYLINIDIHFNMSNKDIIDRVSQVTQNIPIGILRPGQKFDNHIGHSVVNLSDISLSETQISILEKGLTFCPAPGPPD
jgi:hypothetical protein